MTKLTLLFAEGSTAVFLIPYSVARAFSEIKGRKGPVKTFSKSDSNPTVLQEVSEKTDDLGG